MSDGQKVKWACPKCGATASEHGKGECKDQIGNSCAGMICECLNYDDPPAHVSDDDHGETLEKACRNAVCYHCGWGGTFPTRNLIPCPHCKGTGVVKDEK